MREGSAADVDLMDSIDRQTRGAAHGSDHEVMLALGALLVSDTTHRIGLRLRRRAAASPCSPRPTGVRRRGCCGPRWPTDPTRPPIPHVTAANEWAIDVGMAARLELHQEGYLALRGMRPPTPYLHNGALL